jgi:hypothetical protein
MSMILGIPPQNYTDSIVVSHLARTTSLIVQASICFPIFQKNLRFKEFDELPPRSHGWGSSSHTFVTTPFNSFARLPIHCLAL